MAPAIIEDYSVDNFRVYDKTCVGCRRVGKDIMVVFAGKPASDDRDKGQSYIHDFFLSQDQAKDLIEQLQKQLENNMRINH